MFAKTIARTATKTVRLTRPVAARNWSQRVSPCGSSKVPVFSPAMKQWRCLSGNASSRAADANMGEDCSKGSESTHKTEAEIQKEILENALNHVFSHGWSRQALAASAEELGYPTIAEGIFPRGESDLVLYFIRSCNESLQHHMEKMQNEEEVPKTSVFIRDAVEYRLRMIIPYIDSWPEAIAIVMRPPVIFDAVQDLGKMVDDIWFHAGDKSTDFNWYTKRGILAKLYASTQAVMLNDQSPDFTDTWEFLDRRMEDIATFGKVSSRIQQQGQMVTDVGFAGFTVLRNIAGLGERRR